jgi:hypothetical protein
MWSDQDERMRVLARFAHFCRRSPADLLKMNTRTAESWLERWIATIKASRSTKLSYISTVHSFFHYNRRPLPTPRLWTRRLISDRPRVDRFLDKRTFRKMLDGCDASGDKRTKSMLLVQFQSFSTMRSLLALGNSMGVKIAGELRKGANLVPLHFRYRGRSIYEARVSFIGKDACDSLRDWFSVRGWPDPDNPCIWPIGHGGKARELTARDVSNAYSRLAIRLGLRPRKGAGSWVRYGVGSMQVRNLALACAMIGGADATVVNAFAGLRVEWDERSLGPDERFLELSYREIEPHLSV